MIDYRSLKDIEIATLTVYGCSADNWSNVQVATDFSPKYISNVHFSGNNFLGTYDKVFELPGGVKKHAGIYNCNLHNCNIADDVFIDKIHNYIANYNIGEGTYIENVNLLVVDGISSFGNGVKVPVMNEAGGREIAIFDQLSAPLAYIIALYRHDRKLMQQIQFLIDQYVLSVQSAQGSIGTNVRIVNCGSIKNVCIDQFSVLEGVTLLENGSIHSESKAPAYIGAGVQCQDFIISSGTSITASTSVIRCFVGQACILGNSFSALDSVFFANCQGLLGEATSVFAGPYTVTHHKSSMLLAGMFSFFNAGSGTNQSNHMYKLGPVHQGMTERGVKTSSDSYLMWPAQIGAFTVVLGRHKGNPDLSNLPFSYLMDVQGESNLMPGINLHSAGTLRDVQKWPKRDGRKGDLKLDPINFDFLSPYSMSKTLNGIEVLTGLLHNIDEKSAFVWYQNCKIKRSSIKKGIELYEMALAQFIGNQLIAKINCVDILSKSELDNVLSGSSIGKGDWVDMSGLLAPKSELARLLDEINAGNLQLEAIHDQLNVIHENYAEFAWNWVREIIQKQFGKSIQELTINELITIIEQWKKSVISFDDLILRDAKKEFSTIAKTSYGIDGDAVDKQHDFDAVRGTYDDNSFVKDMKILLTENLELADRLIQKFESLN
jgi:Domain of unknown function (DUF4954)